jgi:ribosomal protein S18 acetylase RimI-like enzyme
MITTRIANKKDFELLADLGRRAFQEAFGKHNDAADMQAYLDLAFHPDTIARQLADDSVSYLIALYKDEPVGYAKLKSNSVPPEWVGENCIQLERIYTLQAFIGKKIGKALMEECISIAKKLGFDSIWLSVWQENKVAIDFYKKWGFKIIGYKKFIIGKEVNDDFVMGLKF